MATTLISLYMLQSNLKPVNIVALKLKMNTVKMGMIYMITVKMRSIKAYNCYSGRLPKEMFVNRILTDTASCEVKLGEMRSALFEQFKEAEDFPYGLQAMLKRRVYTRFQLNYLMIFTL